MPVHAEKKVLGYSPELLFDMVADVESYPEFLPWCMAARIKRRREERLIADLIVGFKVVREKFTSQVDLNRQAMRIDVQYVDGPFRHMRNSWVFHDHDEGCLIDFHVDFEFKSRLLQGLMEPLFHEAVRRMVAAFEGRASTLYRGELSPTTP